MLQPHLWLCQLVLRRGICVRHCHLALLLCGAGRCCRTPAGASSPVCSVLTSQEQADIYFKAQSAWYVTLISSQFWHIWVCKTRVVSIQQCVQRYWACGCEQLAGAAC